VAVTVHTPDPKVIVTTPPAIAQAPLAPMVSVPSPVVLAVGVYVPLYASWLGAVEVKVVVEAAWLIVNVPLAEPW
jgi:hypothetical protein